MDLKAIALKLSEDIFSPIPVLFDDLFRFGQILIEMNKKDGSKEKPV